MNTAQHTPPPTPVTITGIDGHVRRNTQQSALKEGLGAFPGVVMLFVSHESLLAHRLRTARSGHRQAMSRVGMGSLRPAARGTGRHHLSVYA